MAVNSLNNVSPLSSNKRNALTQYLPFLTWLTHYRRDNLVGDLMAGLIVTIMLVPQGMAYALLAGLPPQVGLYASITPLIIYGLLGTSRTLAVGPVAIVSLLVASGLSPLADQGSTEYIQLALTLAFLVAIIQFVMGLLRLGFLVNFLSHPVLAGFTSAAAIVIGFSQLKHILGYAGPRTEYFYQSLLYTLDNLAQTNLIALSIGLASIFALIYFKNGLSVQLRKVGFHDNVVIPLSKSGPLGVVILGTLAVWTLDLNSEAGINIVGQVPAGLPALTLPLFEIDIWQLLLPTALAIGFVGYMESISVAKSLASRSRQKVDPDQELIALGAANFGATLTGGYPVTGGFSRSVVNFAAGANTGLASIITAVLIAFTVIFLTPLFYFLPNAVLAAIIIVAVAGLIDLKTLRHVWRYNKADAASMLVTFFAVLALGIEPGILVGVTAALVLFIWRSSHPHMATVGRVGDSETYRNILRHQVKTCPHVIALRVDESLYFANTKYLEEAILQAVSDRPEVKHLVLIGIAINFIDASALETLESLIYELREAGVEFHLAEIKGPVMDRLKSIGFVEHLGIDKIHESTHQAMTALACT